MKNRVRAVILGACLMLGAGQVPVMAAVPVENSAVFTDGKEEDEIDPAEILTDGEIDKTINNLKEKTKEEARKYLEQTEAAKKAEEEARRQARQKAKEEAKKRAEEARQKAEEERLARRQEIVDFALQFEGNPYVYGGTSLTNGADCSGFVMSVFKEFGYELPRVAADQCAGATQKSIEDIEPGDLVFYGDYGIDHVALYIGDSQVIHASTSATGIKISDYTYRQPAAVGTYLE